MRLRPYELPDLSTLKVFCIALHISLQFLDNTRSKAQFYWALHGIILECRLENGQTIFSWIRSCRLGPEAQGDSFQIRPGLQPSPSG